ncbi:MAG TPA: host attachment protein [Steroidobacteraceae bacterium]|nr:host attachment protein [Steroidobacteraceae bacterium]
MPAIRIVVADRSEAIFFEAKSRRSRPTEIARIEDKEARSHERELRTDRPGRTHESVGPARHAVEFTSARRAVAEQRFARRIARRLDVGARRGEFGSVVLVAGPRFLGTLRRALSEQTRAMVSTEERKNLISLPDEDRIAALRRIY